jgi:hypothetical protein
LRAATIVLAMTGGLAVSGIAAPAQAQAARLAATQPKCDPTGGPYPGYVGPYAYSAYYYGYPPDCGGIGFKFFAPAYSAYRYDKPRYVYHRRRSSHPQQ